MGGQGSGRFWTVIDGGWECGKGHKLISDDDIMFIQGRRRCRACHNARNKASSKRHPEPKTKIECQHCGGQILACPVWYHTCTICQKLFTARSEDRVTCSRACSNKRHNQSDDYHRWKRSKRRALTADSDITPAQEGEMRRKARKCAMCKCWLTSKPGQPNTKHLDHIVPINVGGTHTHGNVRIVCRTCNLSRPADGSDYSGPITLWATAPGIAIKAKPQPKPKLATAAKPKPFANCACGNQYHRRGTQTRCHDCIVKIAIQAAELRRRGWKWEAICKELDYENPGGLYLHAAKYGELLSA